MSVKPLTKNGLKARIQRGLTVKQISGELGVSVARICLAFEHFGLDYFELLNPLVGGEPSFRKAG